MSKSAIGARKHASGIAERLGDAFKPVSHDFRMLNVVRDRVDDAGYQHLVFRQRLMRKQLVLVCVPRIRERQIQAANFGPA